jgi:hypothetical protein
MLVADRSLVPSQQPFPVDAHPMVLKLSRIPAVVLIVEQRALVIQRDALPSPTPIAAPPTSPSAATPKQPHDEQQQYRSDGGVDDRADHSGTEVDA